MDVVILALVAAQAAVLIALPFLARPAAALDEEAVEARPDASEALMEDLRTGKIGASDLEDAGRTGEEA